MTSFELDRLDDDGGSAPRRSSLSCTTADARCDGDWWPGSDDAVAELTTLLPQVRSTRGTR